MGRRKGKKDCSASKKTDAYGRNKWRSTLNTRMISRGNGL